MRPFRDFVLVEIIEEDTGGLVVSRDKTDSYQRGKVIATGPGRYESGILVENEFQVGEVIRWAQGADYGAVFEEDDKKLALVRAGQVMAAEVE